MSEGAHQQPGLARDRSKAARIRRAILRSPNRFFAPVDFDAPSSTIRHILSDMASAGELIRVRRGLYWRGEPTRFGQSPPSTDQIARAIAGPVGIGPSGYSAANLLGISTQVPRLAEFAVPSRAPKAPPRMRFKARPGHSGRVKHKLTEREVALLEVLSDLDAVSEMEPKAALARLAQEITHSRVRPEKLARASATENAATRARLDVLLTSAGASDHAATIRPQDHRARGRALAGTAES